LAELAEESEEVDSLLLWARDCKAQLLLSTNYDSVARITGLDYILRIVFLAWLGRMRYIGSVYCGEIKCWGEQADMGKSHEISHAMTLTSTCG